MYKASAPRRRPSSSAFWNRARPSPRPLASAETWMLDRSAYCFLAPILSPSTETKPFSFPLTKAPHTAPPVARVRRSRAHSSR